MLIVYGTNGVKVWINANMIMELKQVPAGILVTLNVFNPNEGAFVSYVTKYTMSEMLKMIEVAKCASD